MAPQYDHDFIDDEESDEEEQSDEMPHGEYDFI
eukprot:CAMPEP_0201524498 /NCGR_PEP_ID=MMETSP0161_2-20130828/22788_1 /ASSEMBLY_ACC=CAM_ASM_000251 /TAXON_ID=180227 /ORGANISM="Neoparamoeba aestuarina, Strain SoJaBio B1-5/56/2" /LENGTH=32 /DNA_ID= /DNA_START= /DNA_END= /DNA_ORIENTATION=